MIPTFITLGAVVPTLIILGVVAVIVLVLAVWIIGAYNRLVQLREQVRAAWAHIDVLLKRRHDLIPNLVETVKGYASHEQETLQGVIAARNQAVNAGSVAEQSQAEGVLSGAMSRLFALAEAYPELKANTNFMQLQGELTETENRIGSQRQGYNNAVQTYNTKLLSFPTNLVAGPFGFRPEQFFELQDPAQREAPAVKF
ncbi:MAG: LemA family protein [Phycisphaerae bacterium]